MVPSPKVATYDLQPEMSAPELTDKAVEAIESGKYDLIVLNFANADMVGHTGSLPAAIKAVEAVDAGLGRIVDAIEKAGGALLVTADHGNCELMSDPVTGGPHTAHTTNPVPVMLMDGTRGAAGRPPRRPRADPARPDGPRAAGGDDRALAARRVGLADGGKAARPAPRRAAHRRRLPRAPAAACGRGARSRARDAARGRSGGCARRRPRNGGWRRRGSRPRPGCAKRRPRRQPRRRRWRRSPSGGTWRNGGSRTARQHLGRCCRSPNVWRSTRPRPCSPFQRDRRTRSGAWRCCGRSPRRSSARRPGCGPSRTRSPPPSGNWRRPCRSSGPRKRPRRPRPPSSIGRSRRARAVRIAGGGRRRGRRQARRGRRGPGGYPARRASPRCEAARIRSEQQLRETGPRPRGSGARPRPNRPGGSRSRSPPRPGRASDRRPADGAAGRGPSRAPLGRSDRGRPGHRHRLPRAAAGRVVAPCAGRVAFAGPFRSFGVLIILDCGAGYHFVLAGLDRLDVQAGTAVQAGRAGRRHAGLGPGRQRLASRPLRRAAA